MALSRSRLRSELSNSVELQALIHKIAFLFSQSSRRVVFEIGGNRFNAGDCTNVVIDETLANNNIQFQRPGGLAVEYYDLADITMVRRLRTKKWMIEINSAADPAMV